MTDNARLVIDLDRQRPPPDFELFVHRAGQAVGPPVYTAVRIRGRSNLGPLAVSSRQKRELRHLLHLGPAALAFLPVPLSAARRRPAQAPDRRAHLAAPAQRADTWFRPRPNSRGTKGHLAGTAPSPLKSLVVAKLSSSATNLDPRGFRHFPCCKSLSRKSKSSRHVLRQPFSAASDRNGPWCRNCWV